MTYNRRMFLLFHPATYNVTHHVVDKILNITTHWFHFIIIAHFEPFSTDHVTVLQRQWNPLWYRSITKQTHSPTACSFHHCHYFFIFIKNNLTFKLVSASRKVHEEQILVVFKIMFAGCTSSPFQLKWKCTQMMCLMPFECSPDRIIHKTWTTVPDDRRIWGFSPKIPRFWGQCQKWSRKRDSGGRIFFLAWDFGNNVRNEVRMSILIYDQKHSWTQRKQFFWKKMIVSHVSWWWHDWQRALGLRSDVWFRLVSNKVY